MNILFFVDGFKGGAGNVVQLLSIELNRRGHKITICCLGEMTDGRHKLTGIDVRKFRNRPSKVFTYISQIIYARKLIQEVNPDCVVSFLFGVSAFVNIALLGKRIPHILSERSDPRFLKPKGLIKTLTNFAYKKCHRIVVLFDAFRNIGNGRLTAKTVTIPNPVPTIDIINENFNPTKIKFVTVANDTPPKGLDLLVKAFSRAVIENPQIKLRIYGSQKNNYLKNYITQNCLCDNIELMGYTMDIKEPLSWADVYIMPSRHEGFPNSLCEAMSAGKCCIATRCHEGIDELLKDNYNGLIANKPDSDDIYNQIKYIINNPSIIPVLGRNAKNINKKYSMKEVTDKWESLIKTSVIDYRHG